MNLDCLGSPSEWADPFLVAARCTGTSPETARQLAGIGLAAASPFVVALLVVLTLALVWRVRAA